MSELEDRRPDDIGAAITAEAGQATIKDLTGLDDYLAATLGGARGWLAAMIGHGGHFAATGGYRFREALPRFYEWPGEAERAVRELTQESHLADVYVCPYAMTNAVRKQDQSAARPLVHADVDGALDYAEAVRLGGFVVGSGRNHHVYVPLTQSVPLAWHKALLKGMRARFGGDDKISDNDLLRPPGTLNRKPTCDGGDPLPVSWAIRPTGHRVDPHTLAAMLGVILPDPGSPVVAPTAAVAALVNAEPVDLSQFPTVQRAFAAVTGDRSVDTHRIVAACFDVPDLTAEHALWVVGQRADLAERLAERRDHDVETIWGKLESERGWIRACGQSERAKATTTRDDDTPGHSGQVRMAYRLAEAYRNRLLHVHGLGWHVWDGTRWRFDDTGAARRAVLDVLRTALAESLQDRGLRADVKKCESERGIAGVLGIAAALLPFAATLRDIDADPYLLNVANGTLDLHTLQLRPHSPADRLTKICRGAYRLDAQSPLWQAFGARVLPDPNVRSFVQRLVGVGLLGDVREHVLPIWTGTGGNGKGVADRAIRHALGDYAITAEPDLFMHRDGGHPTGEMDLRGVRWVSVSETEKDRRLAEATMKRLTGGDTIRARRMRQDFVEFTPSHTPVLITNHLPKVSGDDPAVWRRLRVVPFDVVIPDAEQDAELDAKLALETDGILAWAVAGYHAYRQHGLAEPDTVLAATNTYQRDSDAVRRFIDDECVTTSQVLKATTAQLHTAWDRWRIGDGAEPMSQKAFGLALDRHGYAVTQRDRDGRWRVGIAVKVVSP